MPNTYHITPDQLPVHLIEAAARHSADNLRRIKRWAAAQRPAARKALGRAIAAIEAC